MKERIQISKIFWLSVFILGVLARPIHEFGHYIIYRLLDIEVYYTFNKIITLSGNVNVWGAIGGPMINIIFCIIGIVLIKFNRFKEFSLALIFTNALTRLYPFLTMVFIGNWRNNDEGLIARGLGFNVTYTYLVATLIYISFMVYGILKIDKKRYNTKALIILIICLLAGLGMGLIEIPQQLYFVPKYSHL